MRPYLVFVAATVVIGLFDTFATPQVRGDDSPADFIRRAAEFSAAGKSREAVDAATRAISLQPGAADAYYLRGREHFRLGEIEKSVADFEKLVELRPARKASLWELGISYYYAGEHENGARLFELYQTYHDSDVENGVWRYLCMARTDGVEKARAELLPIKNDPRVPMSEIYDLYRGRDDGRRRPGRRQCGRPAPRRPQSPAFLRPPLHRAPPRSRRPPRRGPAPHCQGRRRVPNQPLHGGRGEGTPRHILRRCRTGSVAVIRG
jgi:hypothetical protein